MAILAGAAKRICLHERILAGVLENAANFQHLLLGDAAGLMCNEPRIAAAVSVLPSLTTLRLNDLASTDVLDSMMLAASPLQKLTIAGDDQILYDKYDHIFRAVSNMCSPNLRTLEIQHMLDQFFSGSPFLSVHRVVLDECSVHTPIGIYLLFPNVRDLILLHTDFEAAEEGNWSDLNYFHGSTHNWICLQMRCSVARLELENTLSLYNVSRRPFDCSTPAEVLQVLQYASPKSLYLCIDTNFDLGEQFWKRFVTSLPRLQCLALALDYVALDLETPESEWLGDFMPWTEYVLPFLQALQIVYLHVAVTIYGPYDEAPRDSFHCPASVRSQLPGIFAQHEVLVHCYR